MLIRPEDASSIDPPLAHDVIFRDKTGGTVGVFPLIEIIEVTHTRSGAMLTVKAHKVNDIYAYMLEPGAAENTPVFTMLTARTGFTL